MLYYLRNCKSILRTYNEPKMWMHICKEAGPTGTAIGEPCNWCDVTQEDIEEEHLDERHDILKEPK